MFRKIIETLLPSRATRLKRREYGPESHGINAAHLDAGALKVVSTLQSAGFTAFIVGGAVRDLMLGIRPKDFDVATNATPEQVRGLFRRAYIIGRRFRIVHVMMGSETIEVTTFRGSSDVQAEADAHGRILSDNTFGTIEEDALRRDFTVNAMYYEPAAQKVLDFVNGKKDVETKTLRLIGDPETRYREDPVRMLRAVRLSAKLNLKFARTTQAPIKPLGNLLENVPAARLFDEIQKILFSGAAVESLKRLRAFDLHKGMLPLLDVIYASSGGQRFVDQALTNTDGRIAQGKTVSPAFLFAALLWQEVKKAWAANKVGGEHNIPALHAAMDSVIEIQCEKMAIPRRFTAITREIWGMQPRFEQRSSSAAERFLSQERFRAAYDFLLLRADCGEIDQDLADWWTAFQSESPAARDAMIRAERERLNKAKSAASTGGSANVAKKRRRSGRSRSLSAVAPTTDA